LSERERAGRLGFLDSLGRLFGAKEETGEAAAAKVPARFEALEADFEVALRGLRDRVAERQAAAAGPTAAARRMTAEERAAEKQERVQASHRSIREDIEKMHAQLGTGVTPAELEALPAFLEDLEAASTEGKDSHSLQPRLRYAISQRLRAEAGELAVARLVALLQRAQIPWPDPTQYRPSAKPEEIERSRRRRLAEVRESFLAQGFERTAERAFGIVKAWGGDYPDRGSPLWEESVLEGVAAGIRGVLVKEFVEVLQRDRDALLRRTEASIGKELAALQGAVAGGVHSIEQANAAVASSLRALDEVVPEIAWEHVRSHVPRARGEFSD
jgi:hypothetical protein